MAFLAEPSRCFYYTQPEQLMMMFMIDVNHNDDDVY